MTRSAIASSAIQPSWHTCYARSSAVRVPEDLLPEDFVSPDCAMERMLAADTVTIGKWGLRLLDPASLDEVFS